MSVTTEHDITNQVTTSLSALLKTPQIIPVLAAAFAEIDPESLHGSRQQIRHRYMQIRAKLLEVLDHELLPDDEIDFIIEATGYVRDMDVPEQFLLKYEPLLEPTLASSTVLPEPTLTPPIMATPRRHRVRKEAVTR